MIQPEPFCPYKGLQPYTEEDRDYFFGREEDQETIGANLVTAPLTILYGASGVGKTSVLLAGVVPFLRKLSNVTVVVFRAWQDRTFLSSLKAEIVHAVTEKTNQSNFDYFSKPLDDLLAHASNITHSTLVVILDQFEEYFVYHPEVESDNHFDAELARAVNREEINAHFLLAIREDSLSILDRFEGRIPNLLGNYLRLEHLDRAAAIRAIRMPLERYNKLHGTSDTQITIEDALVEELIDQVRTGRVTLGQEGQGQLPENERAERGQRIRIETPFLQMVLTRLWYEEIAAGSCKLGLSTLERLGGAEQIVRTHVDNVMVKLSDDEREISARMFRFLVTPTGTKIALVIADLSSVAERSIEQAISVLKTLADARILRTIAPPPEQPTTPRYEIFHDVLAQAILDWRRRYVERQTREKNQREEQQRREQERAEAARKRELERARLMKKVVIGLSLLLFVIILLMIYSLQQRSDAIYSQKEASKAQALAQQRLDRIVKAIKLKQEVLSGDPAKIREMIDPSLINSQMVFRVSATPYGYSDIKGRQIYRFQLFPEKSSIPEGPSSIALITYKMNHPSFRNSLLASGLDRNFTASYDGWGCMTLVIAVIEYTDPDKAPQIAFFDMCKVLSQEGNIIYLPEK